MAGHDNASLQHATFFQTKQFGSILRGLGPPVPAAGVVGDLYMDVQAWQLYEKRADNITDPWGHYLFAVPATYQNTLKWFSASPPGNDIGVTGDYCLLWGGYANYGLQPSIYGPKGDSGWPENGEGPSLNITTAGVLPVGLSDEGSSLGFSISTQLVVVGVDSEYVVSIPVPTGVGVQVGEVGVQSTPTPVAVVLDPLYSAVDDHAT